MTGIVSSSLLEDHGVLACWVVLLLVVGVLGLGLWLAIEVLQKVKYAIAAAGGATGGVSEMGCEM
jgi:hypothetical protein